MEPRADVGDGTVRGVPLVLLRSEGLAVLAMAIGLYARVGRSWWLFLLVLVPDVGMAGYARGSGLGSITYNVVHTYLPPAILGLSGVALDSGLLTSVSLIWFAHIGMDRMLGYGLKYPDGFRHTHLGWIGRGPGRSAG